MVVCKLNGGKMQTICMDICADFHPKSRNFARKKQETMSKALMSMAVMLMLMACTGKELQGKYVLDGAWVLKSITSPDGNSWYYSLEGSGTSCMVYDCDSALYVCELAKAPGELVIVPTNRMAVTLVDKGGGNNIYLEDESPRPLTLTDTTLTIQRSGRQYVYTRVDDIYREWGADIRNIVSNELNGESNGDVRRYVLSERERQQQNIIQWLAAALCLIVVGGAQYFYSSQRDKRRMRMQLQQIKEQHADRALSVRKAMEDEELRFLNSSQYVALQQRLSNGQPLKDEEWQQVEALLRSAYPGFTSQLHGLYPMSELEYRTCLLVKLRIATRDMAAVLARDVSTISTVRSRLYKKVFGQKGSTRKWDDFILSIGA